MSTSIIITVTAMTAIAIVVLIARDRSTGVRILACVVALAIGGGAIAWQVILIVEGVTG